MSDARADASGAGPIKPVHGQPVKGKAVADAAEVKARVDVSEDGGLALKGYDCVNYHTEGKPAMGKEDCEVCTENVLQGRVRYRFATKENADLFKTSHAGTYKPQYGGFCATGGGGGRGGRRRRISTQIRRGTRKKATTLGLSSSVNLTNINQ